MTCILPRREIFCKISFSKKPSNDSMNTKSDVQILVKDYENNLNILYSRTWAFDTMVTISSDSAGGESCHPVRGWLYPQHRQVHSILGILPAFFVWYVFLLASSGWLLSSVFPAWCCPAWCYPKQTCVFPEPNPTPGHQLCPWAQCWIEKLNSLYLASS